MTRREKKIEIKMAYIHIHREKERESRRECSNATKIREKKNDNKKKSARIYELHQMNGCK